MPPTNSEPVTPQISTAEKITSLLRRLAAMLYDSLLVAGLLMFGTLLVMFLRSLFIADGMQEVPNTGISGLIFQIYLVLIVVGFFTVFWVRSGRTLGMQAWRLHVENLQGGRISVRQALIRILGAILSAACGGLGYLWVVFDPEGCSWHDRLSGTRIRWTPKNKK